MLAPVAFSILAVQSVEETPASNHPDDSPNLHKGAADTGTTDNHQSCWSSSTRPSWQSATGETVYQLLLRLEMHPYSHPQEQTPFLSIFDGQEAHMNDHPKVRNEFGLDRENALDVQKERAKPIMPWVIVLVAVAAVVALVMLGIPNTTNRESARVPAPTTTGAGSTTDSR
jgi:hypothetical protein